VGSIHNLNFEEKEDEITLMVDLNGLLVVGDIHGNLKSLFTVLEIVDKMLSYYSVDDGRCKVLFLIIFLFYCCTFVCL
jgi:hypothetical protein